MTVAWVWIVLPLVVVVTVSAVSRTPDHSSSESLRCHHDDDLRPNTADHRSQNPSSCLRSCSYPILRWRPGMQSSLTTDTFLPELRQFKTIADQSLGDGPASPSVTDQLVQGLYSVFTRRIRPSLDVYLNRDSFLHDLRRFGRYTVIRCCQNLGKAHASRGPLHDWQLALDMYWSRAWASFKIGCRDWRQQWNPSVSELLLSAASDSNQSPLSRQTASLLITKIEAHVDADIRAICEEICESASCIRSEYIDIFRQLYMIDSSTDQYQYLSQLVSSCFNPVPDSDQKSSMCSNSSDISDSSYSSWTAEPYDHMTDSTTLLSDNAVPVTRVLQLGVSTDHVESPPDDLISASTSSRHVQPDDLRPSETISSCQALSQEAMSSSTSWPRSLSDQETTTTSHPISTTSSFRGHSGKKPKSKRNKTRNRCQSNVPESEDSQSVATSTSREYHDDTIHESSSHTAVVNGGRIWTSHPAVTDTDHRNLLKAIEDLVDSVSEDVRVLILFKSVGFNVPLSSSSPVQLDQGHISALRQQHDAYLESVRTLYVPELRSSFAQLSTLIDGFLSRSELLFDFVEDDCLLHNPYLAEDVQISFLLEMVIQVHDLSHWKFEAGAVRHYLRLVQDTLPDVAESDQHQLAAQELPGLLRAVFETSATERAAFFVSTVHGLRPTTFHNYLEHLKKMVEIIITSFNDVSDNIVRPEQNMVVIPVNVMTMKADILHSQTQLRQCDREFIEKFHCEFHAFSLHRFSTPLRDQFKSDFITARLKSDEEIIAIFGRFLIELKAKYLTAFRDNIVNVQHDLLKSFVDYVDDRPSAILGHRRQAPEQEAGQILALGQVVAARYDSTFSSLVEAFVDRMMDEVRGLLPMLRVLIRSPIWYSKVKRCLSPLVQQVSVDDLRCDLLGSYRPVHRHLLPVMVAFQDVIVSFLISSRFSEFLEGSIPVVA